MTVKTAAVSRDRRTIKGQIAPRWVAQIGYRSPLYPDRTDGGDTYQAAPATTTLSTIDYWYNGVEWA